MHFSGRILKVQDIFFMHGTFGPNVFLSQGTFGSSIFLSQGTFDPAVYMYFSLRVLPIHP